jgi:hypothetical protein
MDPKMIAVAIIVARVAFAHAKTIVTAKGKFNKLNSRYLIEMYSKGQVYFVNVNFNCNVNTLEKKLRKIIGVVSYFLITRMPGAKKF